MRAPPIVLISLMLTACASAPPRSANQAAPRAPADATVIAVQGSSSLRVGEVTLDVAGKLPADATTDAQLAGRVSLTPADPVRYHVDYALSPGDVLAHPTQGAVSAGLTRIGAQSFGHSLELHSPEVAGAPLSVRLSSMLVDDWTISSHSHAQRDVADLSWASQRAALDLQWRSDAAPADPALALGCGVLGTVELPGGASDLSTRAVGLSGQWCDVVANDDRYTALKAQAWGVSRIWRAAGQESRIMLSMIDPVWTAPVGSPDITPSYELGVKTQRILGAWSAAAGASVRDAGAWITQSGALTPAGILLGLDYTTDATLTRRFGEANVSTTWARGADPLWFVPEGTQSTDRFGVSVDLSSWARGIMPAAAPRVGVSWNWWETQSESGTVSGDAALVLQVSMPL
jgi:hypothetical protein